MSHALIDFVRKTQERNEYVLNPTISTSAYTAGFVVGGIQTIDSSTTGIKGPVGEANLSAILQSLCVLDAANQKAAIDLLFFSALPTGTYTDHTALQLTATDLANLCGKVSIASADYTSYVNASSGSYAVAQAAAQVNLGRVLKPSTPLKTALYMIATTSGTPTYTALALTFKLQFSQGL